MTQIRTRYHDSLLADLHLQGQVEQSPMVNNLSANLKLGLTMKQLMEKPTHPRQIILVGAMSRKAPRWATVYLSPLTKGIERVITLNFTTTAGVGKQEKARSRVRVLLPNPARTSSLSWVTKQVTRAQMVNPEVKVIDLTP